MLTDKLPEDETNLLVDKVNVEVVISDDTTSPLALILPPIEDLNEIKWLEDKNFSLKDFTETRFLQQSERFSWELEKLQKKNDQFSNSPLFLNRLANLAAAAGNFDLEGTYLKRGLEISGESFFIHRKGDNYISRNRIPEALSVFEKADLSKDTYANLRLASLSILNKKIDQADKYVTQAVALDPIDYGARLFQGALRLVQGQYASAVNSFRLAADERPTSSVVQSNLAVAYMGLNLREKALAALRRAVALNPLNTNAVMMLADVAYLSDQNEDAVPSLRYYVQFEQKNAALWSRLARALLGLGQINESVEALKRQGSIERSSAVWNNLGVAYHRKRDYQKSLSAFKYAMSLDTKNRGKDFFLAARNTAVTLSHERTNKDVLEFTKIILAADDDHLISKDKVLSDIAALHIYALARTERMQDAVIFSEQLIRNENIVFQLRIWAATGLLSFYGIHSGSERKAIELTTELLSWIPKISNADSHLKERLLNNISFIYAEFGRVGEAEKYLSQISHLIHKEAYPTAVLGLIHFRKGHLERGTELYEEAIQISIKKFDKSRIRQKLNIELGKYWRSQDLARSRRYLMKAVDVKDGDKDLAKKAKELLQLSNLPKQLLS